MAVSPSPGGPSGRPSSAELRRQRILLAARSHFERLGFRRARIEDIARDAGVAKGAVYLEFESKEALLSGVFDSLTAEIAQRWAAEVLPLESPRERLRATLRFAYAELSRSLFFARLVREDPELGVFRSLAEFGDNPRKADAQLEQIRDRLREGIARGELRADLDLEAMPFVFGSLRFLHYFADSTAMGRLSRERLLEAVIDTFIAGISAPIPPPPPPRKRPGGSTKKR
jgi:AcrR family transcriptional regulator